jgi:hypothetical protein
MMSAKVPSFSAACTWASCPADSLAESRRNRPSGPIGLASSSRPWTQLRIVQGRL